MIRQPRGPSFRGPMSLVLCPYGTGYNRPIIDSNLVVTGPAIFYLFIHQLGTDSSALNGKT